MLAFAQGVAPLPEGDAPYRQLGEHEQQPRAQY